MRLLVARNAAPTIAIMAEHGLLTQVLPIAPITERLSAYVGIEEKIAAGPADPAMRLGALAVAVFLGVFWRRFTPAAVIATFVGVVATGILGVGFLFNALF